MEATFIETLEFSQKWIELGYSQDELEEFQDFLVQNPKAGKVIPGTGGLRKIRWKGSNNKGKSGGSRVLYLTFTEEGEIWLISLYGKGEKSNISESEKKGFKKLIGAIKSS